MESSIIEKEKKGFLDFDLSFGNVNLEKKALFAKHLSVLLKSGLTIAESLEIIANQATGRFKKTLYKILVSIEAGNALSSSFARYPKIFTEIFVNTTLAGEKSGNIDNNFDNLSIKLKKDKELIAKIKGALFYPVIVLIASIALGISVTFLVLPKIVPLFQGFDTELPITTQILISFSNFVQQNRIKIILFLIVFFSSFVWALKQKFAKPYFDYTLIKMPIIKKIIVNANITNFCRTLGMLLKSGLNIDEALSITKETMGNYYYKTSLISVYEKVIQGGKLSDGLKAHPNLYPQMLVSMVMVGENSSRLDETLLYLADMFEEEVDLATKSLSQAIEPILLLGIGVGVGVLALSIITPIYEITGKIQK